MLSQESWNGLQFRVERVRRRPSFSTLPFGARHFGPRVGVEGGAARPRQRWATVRL